MIADLPKGRLLTGAMVLGLCGQLILIWSLVVYGSYSFDRLVLVMFSLLVLGCILCIGYSALAERGAADNDSILQPVEARKTILPVQIVTQFHPDRGPASSPGVKIQIKSETSARLVNIYLSSGEAEQLIATIKTNSPHAHVERRQDKFYVDFCETKEAVG